MSSALHGWLNCAVKITLHAATPHAVQGTLLHVDEAGILLETPAGRLFAPFASILLIESRDEPQRHELAAGPAEIPHECFWRPHA
jgi:hypothetical protein